MSELRCDPDRAGLCVPFPCAQPGSLEGRVQTLLAGFVHLPGVLALVNIDGDANRLHNLAALVANGLQMQRVPAIEAVGAANSHVDVPK
jgi:hypothetical protein